MPKYFFKMYYRGLRIYFTSLVLMRLQRCSFILLAVFCPWQPASNLLLTRLAQNNCMLPSLTSVSTHLINLCYAFSDVNFTKQR